MVAFRIDLHHQRPCLLRSVVYDNYGAKGTADKAMPKIKPGGMYIATLAMTPADIYIYIYHYLYLYYIYTSSRSIDKLVRTLRSDCDYESNG